jgi:hypothetical protein
MEEALHTQLAGLDSDGAEIFAIVLAFSSFRNQKSVGIAP